MELVILFIMAAVAGAAQPIPSVAMHARYDELSDAYTQGFRAGVQSIMTRSKVAAKPQAKAPAQVMPVKKSAIPTAAQLKKTEEMTKKAYLAKQARSKVPTPNQWWKNLYQQRSMIPQPNYFMNPFMFQQQQQQMAAMQNMYQQAQAQKRSAIPKPEPVQQVKKRSVIYPTARETYLASIRAPGSTIGDHPISDDDTPKALSEHDLNINLARSFVQKRPKRESGKHKIETRSAIPSPLSPSEARAMELRESAIARLNQIARRNTISRRFPIRRHRRSVDENEENEEPRLTRHRRSRMPYLPGMNLDKMGIIRAKFDYLGKKKRDEINKPKIEEAAAVPLEARATIPMPPAMPAVAPMLPYQGQLPYPASAQLYPSMYQTPQQAWMMNAALQRRMFIPQGLVPVVDNSYAMSDPEYGAVQAHNVKGKDVVRRSYDEYGDEFIRQLAQ